MQRNSRSGGRNRKSILVSMMDSDLHASLSLLPTEALENVFSNFYLFPKQIRANEGNGEQEIVVMKEIIISSPPLFQLRWRKQLIAWWSCNLYCLSILALSGYWANSNGIAKLSLWFFCWLWRGTSARITQQQCVFIIYEWVWRGKSFLPTVLSWKSFLPSNCQRRFWSGWRSLLGKKNWKNFQFSPVKDHWDSNFKTFWGFFCPLLFTFWKKVTAGLMTQIYFAPYTPHLGYAIRIVALFLLLKVETTGDSCMVASSDQPYWSHLHRNQPYWRSSYYICEIPECCVYFRDRPCTQREPETALLAFTQVNSLSLAGCVLS